MDGIDAAADRLQHRVYRMVLEDSGKRAQIVGTALRRVRVAAVSEGTRSMEPKRTAFSRFFGRSLPPRNTVEQHDAAFMERRLQALRQRGVYVTQRADGKWLRQNRKGKLIPVENRTELVQSRVRRAERRVQQQIRLEARWKYGKTIPPRRFDPGKVSPELSAAYRKRVALECSRIAHDALLDDFRDAAFDRAEQLRVGWVRECEPTACGACLALCDGVVHDAADRTFYRHTRCRCRPVPATSRRPRTGQQIFDSLSESEQDQLFHGRGGREKAQLLRDNRISLTDLVHVATDRLDVTDYVIGETPLEALPVQPD